MAHTLACYAISCPDDYYWVDSCPWFISQYVWNDLWNNSLFGAFALPFKKKKKRKKKKKKEKKNVSSGYYLKNSWTNNAPKTLFFSYLFEGYLGDNGHNNPQLLNIDFYCNWSCAFTVKLTLILILGKVEYISDFFSNYSYV